MQVPFLLELRFIHTRKFQMLDDLNPETDLSVSNVPLPGAVLG